MDFGEILTRAWQILWKYKILWLFGFFASLGAGGNGGGGGNFNFSGSDFSNPQMPVLPLWAERLIDNSAVVVALGVLLLLVLIVVLIVLNVFGKVGLTRGAWLADEGAQHLSFGQLWEAGKRHFGKVLLLILILWALSIGLALVVLIPTIGLSIITFGVGFLCMLPLLCVLAVALWALTVLADLAVVGIVNEDRTVTGGLQNAWQTFKSRPIEIIGMALILWIISLVIGFVIGLPLLLIVAPLFSGLFTQNELIVRGGTIFTIVLFLLYLPIMLFVQSLVQTYIGSTWTLVYRRLTGLRPGDTLRVIDVNPGVDVL
jgi:hypothetical protein